MALTVAACGDNGSSDETTTTNATTTAPDGTTTTPDPTTGMEDPSTTNVDPSTTNVDPSTTTGPDPSTTDVDPSTTGGGVYTCADYCALFLDACDNFNVYEDDADCLAQCAQWPPGMDGAVDGDSFACRYYHVTVASTVDATVHCPHASPNGGGTCVDANAPTCAAYCTEYFKNCTGNNNVYADEADCNAQCEPWYPGSMADVDGDTVGCRLYHSGAALGDADTHCPHASPGGGGICVP